MTPAREFLSRYIARTPLVEAPSLNSGRSPEASGRVFLKLETELPTGSFKARGALYALYVALERRAAAGQSRHSSSVVASSTGNHGAAVAWAAQRLGVPATIFLPRNPNPVKKANIAQFGAAIVEEGRDLSDASLPRRNLSIQPARSFSMMRRIGICHRVPRRSPTRSSKICRRLMSSSCR
jgi:threonine dehydratase